jgi:hypothetical protein
MSTTQEAAAAIVALINKSPRSPRPEEIEAIIAKLATGAQAAPTLSLVHLRYRELLAELRTYEEPGVSEGEEGDAAFAAFQEKVIAFEREIWAKPAETLADVLLLGEIALHNENGLMDALDEPDPYLDDRAAAELIKAVTNVLGGLYRPPARRSDPLPHRG